LNSFIAAEFISPLFPNSRTNPRTTIIEGRTNGTRVIDLIIFLKGKLKLTSMYAPISPGIIEKKALKKACLSVKMNTLLKYDSEKIFIRDDGETPDIKRLARGK